MVTTTSTTSAATATSAQSVTRSAGAAILSSLDTGSGVDTDTLVQGLVEAQFAARNTQLNTRLLSVTAQISGVATLKSMITQFSKALETLVKGGTLASQPVSSNTAALTAAALPGARLSGLSASVSVGQLAGAQTAVSATAFASATAPVGTGQLRLAFGTATVDADGAMQAFAPGAGAAITIDITAANNSLAGIAAAINAKGAGVAASVVTDADGSAYLSLKGATGAAKAFTLSATSTTGDLSAVAVGPGAAATRISSQAANAKLTVDGVAVERASNTVDDLIPGVKMTLAAVTTQPVALSASAPTANLGAAVTDFADTYNEVLAIVKEQTDPVTGPLRGDPAARALVTQLKALTLKPLSASTDGAPTTLAALGVGTNRDGTLTVDDTRLATALKDHPAAVEAMFAYSSSATGLHAVMTALQTSVASTQYGLGASAARYTGQQGDIAGQQSKVSLQSEALSTRLTKQFASMNAAVAAYKSTQAFMQQQVDMWTKSDS